jgi:23S rRNA-/tRNA-specific pseudouridylate synthase
VAELAPVREVYRDGWVLVVDKPSGLSTQAPRGGGDNLFDRLVAAEKYAALHHRLDRPASGLLAVSLDRRANRGMAAAFRDRTAERYYLVVVLGELSEIGEWTWEIQGRAARTSWRSVHCAQGMSVLEARLHTGRTHQIRRHAAQAGHPVIGDRRYGGAAGRAWPRLALHAWRLRLPHPRTGDVLACEANPGPDLAPLLERVGWTAPSSGATG